MSSTGDRRKWQELLDELVNIHKEIRLTLGRKNRSKKWAIWLLQGASLVCTREAIEDEALDRERSLLVNFRYAVEVVDLIAYFNRRTTPQQEAIKWFKGEMWTASPRRDKAARAKEERDAKAYQLSYKNNWVRIPYLNNLISTYLHPSYASVRNSFLWGARAHSLDVYDISGREMLDIGRKFPWNYLRMSILALINGKDVLNYSSELIGRIEGMLEELYKG